VHNFDLEHNHAPGHSDRDRNCAERHLGRPIYAIAAYTPTFAPTSGTYMGPQSLTISDATKGRLDHNTFKRAVLESMRDNGLDQHYS